MDEGTNRVTHHCHPQHTPLLCTLGGPAETVCHKQQQNDKSLSLIPTQDSLKDILARKCQHVNSTVQRNTGVNLGTYTVMKP